MTISEVTDTQRELALALLSLTPAYKWQKITHKLLAEKLEKTEDSMKREAPNLLALVPIIVRLVDDKTFSLYKHDEEIEIKDRFFDIMMCRFEILQKHRKSVIALSTDALHTPKLAIQFYRAQKESMQSTVDLLFAKKRELSPIQSHALLLVYQYVHMVWQRDETKDLASTMAALNKALTQLKKLNIFAAL